MTIKQIVSKLCEETDATKCIFDLKSGYIQISNKEGSTRWAGLANDLEVDELDNEIIPTLLSEE